MLIAGINVRYVPIADMVFVVSLPLPSRGPTARHRVRKTAVDRQLRDAPRLLLAAELPPMRSVRAQLFHRDR